MNIRSAVELLLFTPLSVEQIWSKGWSRTTYYGSERR